MKNIFFISLASLVLFSCSKPSTPTDNGYKPTQNLLYVYNGHNEKLGTTTNYNSTFVEIRTNNGYLDRMDYIGYHYAKNQPSMTSGDYDYFVFNDNGTSYYYPNPDKAKEYENRTIVFMSSVSGAYRDCEESSQQTVNGHNKVSIVDFVTKNPQSGLYEKEFIEGISRDDPPRFNTDSGDDYSYLTDDTISYNLKSCTETQIGYPDPETTTNAKQYGPITLKKADGTIVTP